MHRVLNTLTRGQHCALAAPHTLVVLAYRLRGASTEVVCIGF